MNLGKIVYYAVVALICVASAVFIIAYILHACGVRIGWLVETPFAAVNKWFINMEDVWIERSLRHLYDEPSGYRFEWVFQLLVTLMHIMVLFTIGLFHFARLILKDLGTFFALIVFTVFFLLVQEATGIIVRLMNDTVIVFGGLYQVFFYILANLVFDLSNTFLTPIWNVTMNYYVILAHIVYTDFILVMLNEPGAGSYGMESVLGSFGRRLFNLSAAKGMVKQVAFFMDLQYIINLFYIELALLIFGQAIPELAHITLDFLPVVTCTTASPVCAFREGLYAVVDETVIIASSAVNDALGVLGSIPGVHPPHVEWTAPTSLRCSASDLVAVPCTCSSLFGGLQSCDTPSYQCTGPDENGLYTEKEFINGQYIGVTGTISAVKSVACPHSARRRLSQARLLELAWGRKHPGCFWASSAKQCPFPTPPRRPMRKLQQRTIPETQVHDMAQSTRMLRSIALHENVQRYLPPLCKDIIGKGTKAPELENEDAWIRHACYVHVGVAHVRDKPLSYVPRFSQPLKRTAARGRALRVDAFLTKWMLTFRLATMPTQDDHHRRLHQQLVNDTGMSLTPFQSAMTYAVTSWDKAVAAHEERLYHGRRQLGGSVLDMTNGGVCAADMIRCSAVRPITEGGGSGACVADPTQCPAPQEYSTVNQIRWVNVQGMSLAQESRPESMIANIFACFDGYGKNPDSNPLSLQGFFKDWQTDQTLVFCFPLTRGVTYVFPPYNFNFDAWVAEQCGPSGCSCDGYITDTLDVQGSVFPQMAAAAVAILIDALRVFGYVFGLPFRLTGIADMYRGLMFGLTGILPAWFTDLLGAQGMQGGEGQLLLCAVTKGAGPLCLVLLLMRLGRAFVLSFGRSISLSVLVLCEFFVARIVGLFRPSVMQAGALAHRVKFAEVVMGKADPATEYKRPD